MFNHSVMSGTDAHDLRGVWALLALIATPQSEAAQALLKELSVEKDAAMEARAAADAGAKTFAKEQEAFVRMRDKTTKDFSAREAAVSDRESRASVLEAKLENQAKNAEGWSKALAAAQAKHEETVDDYTRNRAAREANLVAREKDLADRIAIHQANHAALAAVVAAAKQVGV